MKEEKDCEEYPDPIHAKCEYTEWTECKATSGDCNNPKGKRTRSIRQTRTPNNCPLANSCSDQGFKDVETADCSIDTTCAPVCEKVDCDWSWQPWGKCSDPCNGKMKRMRQILKEPECGGAKCPSDEMEEEDCSVDIIDCDWKCARLQTRTRMRVWRARTHAHA